MSDEDSLTYREQLRALIQVAQFRPRMTGGIVCFALLTAALEGIGLGFILPIIEVSQSSGDASGGLVGMFASAYEFFGIPFVIEFIILGVGVVLAVRYMASYLMAWLTAELQTAYIEDLRTKAFTNALDARIGFFDTEGSDDILNAIVTQTQFAGQTIKQVQRIIELSFISVAYLLLAFYFAPVMMLLALVVLGGFMYGIRHVLESGYSVGDRVAEANEEFQASVQAGMQGIRDVKLFNLQSELVADFRDALDTFVRAMVHQRKNKALINNFNKFMTAATVFALVYFGLEVASLSLGALGVFLFAMFRLGPKISNLNDNLYQAESSLPHLVRTQEFVGKLESNRESTGSADVPVPVDEIVFEDVDFRYKDEGEQVLDNLSFSIERGDFVAFVGPSGAGKSTIVSLLARMYDVDYGEIMADGTAISDFDVNQWRSRISVVRQDPFIFNDTLLYNLTLGNRDVSRDEIDRVCRIAKVDEFMDDLPKGYDTQLGDNGIRLSGGQKQRVAIARALLKDADFLVLDEATSDLDSHLEEDVHRGIESMDRDYGIIAIAHRLSTVTDADQIYVMEDGMIEESGQHRGLVELDGKYADLYETQSQTV